MKAIADTGLLVAFANGRDTHHAWARAVIQRLQVPVLTCEAVLAEAAFHLQSATIALKMVQLGLVQLAFQCREHVPALADLANRFADQKPDLADLCVIRMSELHGDHVVVTTDERDFRIYRRNKREAIPLLCPSNR